MRGLALATLFLGVSLINPGTDIDMRMALSARRGFLRHPDRHFVGSLKCAECAGRTAGRSSCLNV